MARWMTAVVERGATTSRLKADWSSQSNGKNYRNIFCPLKPRTENRPKRPAHSGRPPLRIIRRGGPTVCPLWPRRSCTMHTRASRTRTDGNTSGIRMVQTLPCCTTNESPSLAKPFHPPQHSRRSPRVSLPIHEPFEAGFLSQSGSSYSNVYRAYWNSR